MSWKTFLKDYFRFSRAERFGMLGLCGFILAVLIVRLLLLYWVKPQIPDITAFSKEIAQFRQAVDSALHAKDVSIAPNLMQVTPDLFYFDPNRTTDEEWERLGLNERQIKNIRNYQASGGNFRRKEDLKKLYSISATQYQRLEPYIRLAANVPSVKQAVPDTHSALETKESEKTTYVSRRESKIQVELNTADSSLLTQLSGIGPVLASRTVKYRSRMGGFVDVAQLGEVYGITPELVERLAAQLSADSSLIKKIPVNTAIYKDLINHPYLNDQQVRGILNYRRLQNRINNLNELVRNNILKSEEAERLRPYLAF